MPAQERIDSLRQKHAQLDYRIEKEVNRPLPDQVLLKDLKFQKLRIKDEITELMRH
jgi:hypothetical protein